MSICTFNSFEIIYNDLCHENKKIIHKTLRSMDHSKELGIIPSDVNLATAITSAKHDYGYTSEDLICLICLVKMYETLENEKSNTLQNIVRDKKSPLHEKSFAKAILEKKIVTPKDFRSIYTDICFLNSKIRLKQSFLQRKDILQKYKSRKIKRSNRKTQNTLSVPIPKEILPKPVNSCFVSDISATSEITVFTDYDTVRSSFYKLFDSRRSNLGSKTFKRLRYVLEISDYDLRETSSTYKDKASDIVWLYNTLNEFDQIAICNLALLLNSNRKNPTQYHSKASNNSNTIDGIE